MNNAFYRSKGVFKVNRAFSMTEMVLVIVVIGILAGIAVPRMSVTRDDATLVKARTTVASIRSAISTEVQKRQMAGDYTPISNLGGEINGHDKAIFDYFDAPKTESRVLEYPPHSCKAGAKGCWMRTGENTYTYYFPASIGGSVNFNVSNNRFECDSSSSEELCAELDR